LIGLVVFHTSLACARLVTDRQTDKHRHQLKPHCVGRGFNKRNERHERGLSH